MDRKCRSLCTGNGVFNALGTCTSLLDRKALEKIIDAIKKEVFSLLFCNKTL
jgi:hypothetical protein